MNETLKGIVNTTSSDFQKDQGNAFGVSVDGKTIIHLYFIFISLDYNSKQCKTKNDLTVDLSLIISAPNMKYFNLVNLGAEPWMTIDEPEKSNFQIKYTLKGKKINLINSDFTLYFTGRPEKILILILQIQEQICYQSIISMNTLFEISQR